MPVIITSSVNPGSTTKHLYSSVAPAGACGAKSVGTPTVTIRSPDPAFNAAAAVVGALCAAEC